MNIKINKERAFTLIELLVVISIIALLSTIVLSALSDARDKAKISKAQQDMRQIYNALILYIDENGEAPKESTGTTWSNRWVTPDCNLPYGSSSVTGPNGVYINYFNTELDTYIDTSVLDPWGTPYWADSAYNCSGEPEGCEKQNNGVWVYALVSSGPNKSARNSYDSDNVIYMICDYDA